MSTQNTQDEPVGGGTPEAAAELADNLRSVKALGEDRVGDASAPYEAESSSTDENGDDDE